jgi:hypothetical protein
MRIPEPVLAPDVSIWCDHINAKEFEDAGCASVVVGLYSVVESSGAKSLSPISRQQCIDVVTKSSMVLQAYFWDDIILDPNSQVDWLIETLKKEGLPIRWIWIDQEQWWTNWTAWQQARGGKIPWTQVPKGSPGAISSHYESFNTHFQSHFANSGVYTNKGFVSTWAPGMDNWLPKYRAWVPHYGRQPKEATRLTWAQFKEKWLPNYDIVLSAGQKSEKVAGHQFTGDVCILPGSYSKSGQALTLDVSSFSKAFIDSIRGGSVDTTPPSTPPPTPIPQPTTKPYTVLYDRINVRVQPSSNAAWVRFAVKNEVLQVAKVENGWAQLSDGNYVFSGYIKAVETGQTDPTPPPTTTPPATTPPPPGTVDYVVLHSRINVRAKPSSNSTWVRFAEKDEVLHIVKIDNGWAQISDGTYVFADYIRKS